MAKSVRQEVSVDPQKLNCEFLLAIEGLTPIVELVLFSSMKR